MSDLFKYKQVVNKCAYVTRYHCSTIVVHRCNYNGKSFEILKVDHFLVDHEMLSLFASLTYDRCAYMNIKVATDASLWLSRRR